MGCDIHMHVEYKRHINGEEKWVLGDYFIKNPYYNYIDKNNKSEQEYYCVGFCEGRNYGLFATLADVRNYGNTPYICNPKGLPNDVTTEVKEDIEYWGYDGHSRSFFKLKELIDFYKENPKIKYRGMISPEQQELLDDKGITPNSWCQGTNQIGYEFREWEEDNYALENLITKLKERADELHLIYDFLWEDGRYEEAYKLSDKIRIVFWFDN